MIFSFRPEQHPCHLSLLEASCLLPSFDPCHPSFVVLIVITLRVFSSVLLRVSLIYSRKIIFFAQQSPFRVNMGHKIRRFSLLMH